jgi:hypothetical protein
VDEEMMRRLEQQQQMERNKEELVSVKSNAQEVSRKLEAQRQRMRDIEQELANARSYLNNTVNQASESNTSSCDIEDAISYDYLQESALWKLRGPDGRLPACPQPMDPKWLRSNLKLTKLFPRVFLSTSLLDPLVLRYLGLP